MKTVNYKSIKNGLNKTDLKSFLAGKIGSRTLIKNAKTNIARSELYRLERNNSVSAMRNLIKNALGL